LTQLLFRFIEPLIELLGLLVEELFRLGVVGESRMIFLVLGN